MLTLMRSVVRFLYTLGHSVIVRLLFAVSTILFNAFFIFIGCVLILVGILFGGAILATIFPSLDGAVEFLAAHIYWLFGIWAVFALIWSGTIQDVVAAFTESGDALRACANRRVAYVSRNDARAVQSP